jgi:putative addiction module component (TIGR02574 family)
MPAWVASIHAPMLMEAAVNSASCKRPVVRYDAPMRAEVERLLAEAMELPEHERAALVAILQDSLGDGTPEDELEAAWAVEIQRRLAAVQSGEAELIPTEDVERELEAILERADEPQRAAG